MNYEVDILTSIFYLIRYHATEIVYALVRETVSLSIADEVLPPVATVNSPLAIEETHPARWPWVEFPEALVADDLR